MDNILELIIAILGSGTVATIITHIMNKRKYSAEVDELRQQIDAARTDDRIKIDEHIQSQFMEIAESYKLEIAERKKEMDELRKQNVELLQQVNEFSKQINDLNTQIDQFMSWFAYDMMGYLSWIEKELLKSNPGVQLPSYRKPPKFVQEYLEANNIKHCDEK